MSQIPKIPSVTRHNSPLKIRYSFPRSPRFSANSQISFSPNKYYDLPEIKSKRAAGMGFDKKSDIASRAFEVPASNSYLIRSEFDLKKNEGLTMGAGRDTIKANNMFGRSFQCPSPLEYNPESREKGVAYSMSPKAKDLTRKWIESVPGPGSYSVLEVTNKLSKVQVSKYLSAPSAKFSHKKKMSDCSLQTLKTPGPGQYNTQNQAKTNFSSRNGSKFPLGKRSSLENPNKTPGPGLYEHRSGFE